MLEDIVDQLYALPPAEFTAARDRAARTGGVLGKQIKALRRPTASAHLVNALVRAEPALLTELLDLGPELAHAQSEGDGAAVRALGEQRRQLVGRVADRAVQLADGPVSPVVRDEVATTLEAGLADPAIADAVRSGRLVRALSFVGFGGVDLDGAVAVPVSAATSRRHPSAVETHPARVAEAEQRALAAGGALDDAVRARKSATTAYDAAQAEAQRTEQALTRLRAQVDEAERSLRGAQRAEQAAQERVEATGSALLTAQADAEQARQALDALRRKG